MPTDKELLALISTLSLQEKTALCSGIDFWRTKPNPARGIPQLMMADGPHGLRYEDRKNRRANGGGSRRATCWPSQVTLACAWSPKLTRRVGAALAAECRQNGVGLLLGPGVNIKRGPLGGRNFEYYSEDPLLAGELAAGLINGLQQNGVGASLKHYAVNNQEKYRMSIDARLDDRALFDLYLKPFEIAIRKAQPATVMASYNRLNGAYATENRRLLTDILRLRFGFTGAVVSDWGAVNDRPAGIAAGCDLEMPTSGGMNDWAIERAVASGFLPEDALDTACLNLLRLIFTYAKPAGGEVVRTSMDPHDLAVEALCKSAVLLYNPVPGGPGATEENAGADPAPGAGAPEGPPPSGAAREADGQPAPAAEAGPLLPFADNGARLAVIGEMAAKPRYQGGGSSHINPRRLVGFLQAMKAAGRPFVYAPGHAGTKTTPKMLAAAAQAAQGAKNVVLFLGLPDAYECEGYDRTHLRLPEAQLKLLDTVAAANPNVCVVLCCGAPVEMPWLRRVRAVLCPHLGGEGLGEALVKLLYGQANPGGKLAESWPVQLEDTPAFHHFPMGPDEVRYNESLYVGYRYYNTAQKPVLFPFGHGLSYTTYAYSALTLDSATLERDQPLAFSLEVENTGAVAGEEIVQVYLARKGSAHFQPAHELIAFDRVPLAPGERKTLRFTVPYTDLAFTDPATGARVVEQGLCTLQAGPSSRRLPLAADFTLRGMVLAPTPAASASGPYARPTGNAFPDEGFTALSGHAPGANALPAKGAYSFLTPIGLMKGSVAGRGLARLAQLVARLTVHFSADKEANHKAARESGFDLPFKNLPLATAGMISPRAAAALLDLCNGQGSLPRFVGGLLARPPYRRRRR